MFLLVETKSQLFLRLLQSRLIIYGKGSFFRGHSTIYDVLEYALKAGALPVRLSKECAALWVFQLAELDEWELFEKELITQKSVLLLESAMDDGLAEMTKDPLRVARIILAAQALLLELCSDYELAS